MSSVEDIIKLIDHTALKPAATEEDIIELCKDAKEYGTASVCVNPWYVELAKKYDVMVSCVVDFPAGTRIPALKGLLTKEAIGYGADEIDMVIHKGSLKVGNPEMVRKGIEAVLEAASGKPVKVIYETCELTKADIVEVCDILNDIYRQYKKQNKPIELYAKTSTGFGSPKKELGYAWNQEKGATLEAVELMHNILDKEIGIKAAGGIKTKEDADKYLEIKGKRKFCVGDRKFRIGASGLLKNLVKLLE